MESQFVTSDYDLSNIRMRKETKGGCAYDLGCYTTSMILWMTGRLEAAMEKKGDLYGCMAVIVVCLFTLTEAHFVSEYIGRNFLFVMTAPYLPAIFGTEAVKEEKA